MTCIVGFVEGKRVWIGGDSAGITGNDIAIHADEKVFVNGPMIIGFCGSFRMRDILRYELVVPEPQRRNESPDRYMATTFVNAVRRYLLNGGYAEKKDNVEQGGTFLVGYKGALFCIEDDYHVFRPAKPYVAIGSGGAWATGAIAGMIMAADDIGVALDVQQTIERALQVASDYDACVRPPYTILKK